jgi:hypothetical protein
MTRPVIIERAKSFYDEVKMTSIGAVTKNYL